ncbi:MAG: transcriptional regulator [Pantoea sp.]|nr:transcriptional regulator [Pantoea sp.]
MPSLLPLQLFKNLSDETRLSLVLFLLRESGLLIDRRDGKWIHYRLSPHMPAWAAAVIEQAYLCQRDEILHLSQQAERDNATTNGKAVCM